MTLRLGCNLYSLPLSLQHIDAFRCLSRPTPCLPDPIIGLDYKYSFFVCSQPRTKAELGRKWFIQLGFLFSFFVIFSPCIRADHLLVSY